MHIHLCTAKKTATYTIVHFVVAFSVALAVTQSLKQALAISLIEPVIQIAGYSIHEYLWLRSKTFRKLFDKETNHLHSEGEKIEGK